MAGLIDLFFKGIISKTRHDYIKDSLRRDETHYSTDLAEQCYRNAEIANKGVNANKGVKS